MLWLRVKHSGGTTAPSCLSVLLDRHFPHPMSPRLLLSDSPDSKQALSSSAERRLFTLVGGWEALIP